MVRSGWVVGGKRDNMIQPYTDNGSSLKLGTRILSTRPASYVRFPGFLFFVADRTRRKKKGASRGVEYR